MNRFFVGVLAMLMAGAVWGADKAPVVYNSKTQGTLREATNDNLKVVGGYVQADTFVFRSGHTMTTNWFSRVATNFVVLPSNETVCVFNTNGTVVLYMQTNDVDQAHAATNGVATWRNVVRAKVLIAYNVTGASWYTGVNGVYTTDGTMYNDRPLFHNLAGYYLYYSGSVDGWVIYYALLNDPGPRPEAFLYPGGHDHYPPAASYQEATIPDSCTVTEMNYIPLFFDPDGSLDMRGGGIHNLAQNSIAFSNGLSMSMSWAQRAATNFTWRPSTSNAITHEVTEYGSTVIIDFNTNVVVTEYEPAFTNWRNTNTYVKSLAGYATNTAIGVEGYWAMSNGVWTLIVPGAGGPGVESMTNTVTKVFTNIIEVAGIRLGTNTITDFTDISGSIPYGGISTITYTGTNIATDLTFGNAFRVTLTNDAFLDLPTGIIDGQIVRWWIKQGTGTNRLYANFITNGVGSLGYVLPTGATNLDLSVSAGSQDLLIGEYDAANTNMHLTGLLLYPR